MGEKKYGKKNMGEKKLKKTMGEKNNVVKNASGVNGRFTLVTRRAILFIKRKLDEN